MPERCWQRPERIWEGRTLWLEISEFPDKPKVQVRVFKRRSGMRWEVEFFGDGTLALVPEGRLYEEAPPR